MRRSTRRALAAATAAACVAGLVGSAPADAFARPLADSFVTRDGTRLSLQGRQFRFAGTDIYWLGLDENAGGVAYPTYFRIDDALQNARIMDASVVRSTSIGVSVGCALCIEPSLGTFNDDAFDTIDYALAQARNLGLRLVIPLTDNGGHYTGGDATFTDWLGDSGSADFYTDPRVIAAFKTYVGHLLNHVNKYTGIAYKDDPTIMSWELGGELNGMPLAWVDDLSAYLKHNAPDQLVSAGSQTGLSPAALAAPGVDILDAHLYPAPAAAIASAAATTVAAGKVFMAGESDPAGSTTDDVLAGADNPEISGQMFSSLFGHDDTGGSVQHGDGFTVHHPGDTTAMRQHVIAYQALGELMDPQYEAQLPAVPSTPPLITAIAKHYGENQVTWRGTDGAATYAVARSTTGPAGPYTVLATGLTDSDTPYTDTTYTDTGTPAATAWYTVTAYDWNRQALAASPPLAAGATQDTVTDPLESWTSTSAHSPGLVRTPVPGGVSVAPAQAPAPPQAQGQGQGQGGQITWSHAGLASITGAFDARDPRRLPQIQTSADGTTWSPAPTKVTATAAGLSASATLTGSYVRLSWTGDENAPVTGVAYSYATASPAPVAPGAFRQQPADGATGVNTGTALTWTASNQAAYYDVTVSANPDLSAPVIYATDLAGTTYTPTTSLAPNTTYYYEVSAVNATGSSAADGAPSVFTTAGQVVDDFSAYRSSAALAAAYVRNTNGDAITPRLDTTAMGAGDAMRLDYTLGANGYAGVGRSLAALQNWGGADALSLWVKNDGGSGHSLTVQFVANGIFWQDTVDLSGQSGAEVSIPLSDFQTPAWAQAGLLDLSSVTQLSFYIGGPSGPGTVWIGDVVAGR